MAAKINPAIMAKINRRGVAKIEMSASVIKLNGGGGCRRRLAAGRRGGEMAKAAASSSWPSAKNGGSWRLYHRKISAGIENNGGESEKQLSAAIMAAIMAAIINEKYQQ